MKRRVFFHTFAIAAAFFAIPLGAQQIVTAENYLERVSNVYAGFNDYEAKLTIHSGNSVMSGTVSHREPYFLRIDFTNPANQVIVFNGTMLTVYLPGYSAILNQSVADGSSVGSLATSGGLSMMRRNYAAAYVSGPAAVALDSSSAEKVVKLNLTRRYNSEGFRDLTLSINPQTLIIRRIEATTVGDSRIIFDFENVRTNIGIGEGKFNYDSPASANMYNNFLFRD